MTDLREALGAQRLAGEVKRHRHRWTDSYEQDGMEHWHVERCACGAIKDAIRSRRGKTARRRGNDYERSVATRLGLKRVGQYGSTVDVGGGSEWMAVQVKNGGAFPERIWCWLDALPRDADRLRAVVIGDAPGPGRPRREVIVLDFGDFVSWFGGRRDDD